MKMSATICRISFLFNGLWIVFIAVLAWASLTRIAPMIVGNPIVDERGVKGYPVTSLFLDPKPTIVRVLEPTHPAPGKPRRFLYVLPVSAGVTNSSSENADGLEELRRKNLHNRYNLTLIAPSFHITPWYGDHESDRHRRLESFIIKDLVPFGDSFALRGQIPQRWLLGFSKSGFGALALILRHPNVFTSVAAWDAPVELTDISRFQMGETFGTVENFQRYQIPRLVANNGRALGNANRIWIGGNPDTWGNHMLQLHVQMKQTGIPHSFAQNGPGVHSWSSGWLESAVASLDANAPRVALTNINVR